MGNIKQTPHKIGELNRARYLQMMLSEIARKHEKNIDTVIEAPKVVRGRWENGKAGTLVFIEDEIISRQGTDKLRKSLAERGLIELAGEGRSVKVTEKAVRFWQRINKGIGQGDGQYVYYGVAKSRWDRDGKERGF